MSRKATGARAARQRAKTELVNLDAAEALVRDTNFETYSKNHPMWKLSLSKRVPKEEEGMALSQAPLCG